MATLLKLIYASKAADGIEGQLENVLAVARSRNESLGITGLLMYAHGSFMQHLEGDDDSVEAVYESIAKDTRHTELRLLTKEAVDARRFADWTMGFEQPGDDQLVTSLPGYKPSVTYPLVNPALVLNATVAETLLGLYARNP